MTPHPRALQAGEALLVVHGGQGQSMEGVEQGQRRELPEAAEESARKAQRFDEDTAVQNQKRREVKHFTHQHLQEKFDK